MNVYSELKKASLENLAADPVTNLVKGRVYFNTVSNEAKVYDGTSWGALGGGGGSGFNYATGDDSDFETAVGAGWGTFASSATPTTLTGGSPTLTATRTVTTPLRGAGALLLTAGGQYDGAKFTYTQSRADLASMQEVSFDYEKSITGADGDWEVWIEDVTNGAIIQPVPYKVPATSGQEKFRCTWQSSSSGTSYRVGIRQAIASPGNLEIDSFYVGPMTPASMGAPVTDWQSYTLSTTGVTIGSGSTTAYYRRVGDSLEGYGYINLGASGAGEVTATITASIPSGLTIDTAKITSNSTLGSAKAYDASVDIRYVGGVAQATTTTVSFFGDISAAGPWNELYPFNWTTSDFLSWHFTVPIVNWSSNVAMSSDAGDSRLVEATYFTNATTSTTLSNPINFNTKSSDKASLVTTGASWNFTAGSAGSYLVATSVVTSAATKIALWKNGSAVRVLAQVINAFDHESGSTVIELNAGDYIDIRPTATVDVYGDVAGSNERSHITIFKLQSPQQIAASETVAASYTTGSGTLSGTASVTKYTTKKFDTHGAYDTSTGLFTAPISGLYSVTGAILVNGSATSGTAVSVEIFVGGSKVHRTINRQTTTHSVSISQTTTALVRVLAGQTIGIYTGYDATTPVYTAQTDLDYININRVGNY